MKKLIRVIVIGASTLILVAIAAVFVFLPSVFDAKYVGPTLITEDGKALVTMVRLPEGDGPFPTLIVRSPYELPHTPLSGMPSEDFSHLPDKQLPEVGWQPVLDAGYALVVQHTRGRVGSEGIALDLKDKEDAIQLIKWIKEQPWSNGKIGTTGDSIEAILAMVTNAGSPELVDASYVQIGTPNLVNDVLKGPGGALKLELFFPWAAEQILTADANHYREMGFGPIKRRTSIVQMGLAVSQIFSDLDNAHTVKAWQRLPLKDYPHFSEASDAWNAMLDAAPDSEVAQHFDGTDTSVPTFYVAAWFDVFSPSQLSAFADAEAKNRDQRLLILNGTHFTPEDPGAWPIQPMLPWFDFHLKGDTSALLDLPRVVFPIANEDDEWYGTDTWPPSAASETVWTFSSNGTISRPGFGGAEPGQRNYVYDPANPVPTVGGRNLLISNGALDQSAIRENTRSDVLSYDSAELTSELIVMGHIRGQLSISSSAPDTDFTMKVMDVAPDGTATLLTEGIQRARFREGRHRELFLEPGEIYSLDIDLGHIAWRFKPGHRISVDVSSSNFPQWDRNLNTGQDLYSSTEIRIATNTIHHGAESGSFIELPVVSDPTQLERLAHLSTSLGE
ncbi:MAG: CocE/NonD family hydrolase [Henriciella sp.]